MAASTAAPSSADTADFEAIALEYLADRASRVTADHTPASRISHMAMTAAQRRTYRAHADRLDAVRAGLDDLHGGYRRATTRVSVAAATVDRSAATLRVAERTELAFVLAEPNAPDHTTYLVDHELELHRTAKGWRLGQAAYLPKNSYSTPVTQFDDELPQTMLAERADRLDRAVTTIPPPGRTPLTSSRSPDDHVAKGTRPMVAAASYDYEAMVRYAYAWYDGRSPIFPEFEADCTNFVSQCMWAGNWPQVGGPYGSDRSSNSNWFYGPATWLCSYTWGSAENWYWFATGSGRTYIIYMWDMLYADVLQYDFDRNGVIDHTQICTATNSAGPLMTQHDSDYADRPLSEIMQNPDNANAWKYAHRT